ncbi:MAG: hypothetical protein ACK55I_42030, partial [bacterium]
LLVNPPAKKERARHAEGPAAILGGCQEPSLGKNPNPEVAARIGIAGICQASDIDPLAIDRFAGCGRQIRVSADGHRPGRLVGPGLTHI